MSPKGNRLDIRTQLLIFTAALVWTMGFPHPIVHGTLGLGILGVGLATGLGLRAMLSRLLPLAPLMVMILGFMAFAGEKSFVHPENQALLFTLPTGLGDLCLYQGNALMGLTFILRLTNMVMLTLILMATTPLDAFISLFMALRLPPTLSFIITTAIRFIPELDKKRQLILTAQRARGIGPEGLGPWGKLKVRMAVMVPLIVNAILLADHLSMALMNRGFGYRPQWTPLSQLRLGKRDYPLILLGVVALAWGIFLAAQGRFFQI